MTPTAKLIEIRDLITHPLSDPTPRATLMKIVHIMGVEEPATGCRTPVTRMCSPVLAVHYEEGIARGTAELVARTPKQEQYPVPYIPASIALPERPCGIALVTGGWSVSGTTL